MGAPFAPGTSLGSLIGIPSTRLFVLASVIVGFGIAGLLYFWHKRHRVEHTDLYKPPRPKEEVSVAEFVGQLQAATTKVVGPVVAACVVQSQLKRNLLTAEACSAADCKKLMECTVEAIGVFATKDETPRLQLELEGLYRSSLQSS